MTYKSQLNFVKTLSNFVCQRIVFLSNNTLSLVHKLVKIKNKISKNVTRKYYLVKFKKN